MTSPKFENRFNLTTLVAAANLALLLVGGGSAYATVRAELKSAHENNLRVSVDIAQIRAAALASIEAAEEIFSSSEHE